MNVKDEVIRLFRNINHNLNNINPTKITLEKAMRKPIHHAFKSVPKEHYRKLYREISKITHPDKLSQADSNTVSEDPSVIFCKKINQMAQTLNDSDRDVFLRTPQQLVETYKDCLPDVAELLELASHQTTKQFINQIKKSMIAVLKRSIQDSERYNVYIQRGIYVTQALVNTGLILTCVGISIGVLHILPMILLYANFSLVLACLEMASLLYLAIRTIEDPLILTGFNAPLLFFIGIDALDKALKEYMPTAQLASDYRMYYKDEDEVMFTEEDSDDTVLNYAKNKLFTNSFDIEHKRLRRNNIHNRPFWQYPQLLSRGFFHAMRTTLPVEQRLVSQKFSSEPQADYLLFHYERNNFNTWVRDIVNTRSCGPIVSTTPWIDFYPETSNSSCLASNSSQARDTNGFTRVTQQDMNPKNLPIIHHIDNTLYSWNNVTKTLEPLTLETALKTQLPSNYILNNDSIFYFDTINEQLHRLNFNEPQEQCCLKSQYIFFNDTLFYYNNFTRNCEKIALIKGPLLDVFKEKFAYGTQIEALSAEQLAFIKQHTQHSNHSSQTMFICLKLLRAVCFIPFILTESIVFLGDLILKAFLISLMYVAFAIKISITMLLNLPLYAYEACITPDTPPDIQPQENNNYAMLG